MVMKQTTIIVKEVKVDNYAPKENTASLRISYMRDAEKETMFKKVILKNPEELTAELMKDIKARSKIELSEADDPLGSIFVVHMHNEDNTEEKLFNFLAKVCEKCRYLKHITNHHEYMKVYDEIKIQKIQF